MRNHSQSYSQRSRQRRNGQISASRRAASEQAKTNVHLKDIYELEKTQQDMSIPRVLDIVPMKLKRDKVYTFSRANPLPDIVSAATAIGLGYQFSLNSIPAFADFTSLFEQYRIVQISFKFVPVVAGSTSTVSLYSWIDQDDAQIPTSLGDGLQSETLLIAAPNKYFERHLIPHSSSPVYNTGSAFSSYSQSPTGVWIDNQYPNVVYYGLKVFYNPTAFLPNNTVLYNVFQETVIQCRRPV